jgi:hypothetical protein
LRPAPWPFPGTTRWALPDKIATTKTNSYARQQEFRLVFTLTNALDSEVVDVNLVPDGATSPLPSESGVATHFNVGVQSIRDICRIRDLG